jgi:hypothetical protein
MFVPSNQPFVAHCYQKIIGTFRNLFAKNDAEILLDWPNNPCMKLNENDEVSKKLISIKLNDTNYCHSTHQLPAFGVSVATTGKYPYTLKPINVSPTCEAMYNLFSNILFRSRKSIHNISGISNKMMVC